MDEYRENVKKVQKALNQDAAFIQPNPYLAQRVLNAANAEYVGKGGVGLRRKYPFGVVLTIVMLLATATAVAVVLLTASQYVETEVVPVAQNNDTVTVNEWFSNDELEQIITLAKENNIAISEQLAAILQSGQGYYEAEVIQSLLRDEFGYDYAAWTIEQKHWYGEVMVAIGFWETNTSCLPGEGDIAYDKAVEIAQDFIVANYGDDISDEETWKRWVTYNATLTDEGSLKPAVWFLEFVPVSPMYNKYQITINNMGEVLACDADLASAVRESGDALVSHYISVYGGLGQWTYETWASLGHQLKKCLPDTMRSWVFYKTEYILPPENGLSYESAKAKAMEFVGSQYATVGSAVCCNGLGQPTWKIEVLIQEPEDVGSGQYTAIWLVEIDCTSGNVIETCEFVVGSEMDPLITYVPQELWDNMPSMPETPNG